MKKKQYAIILAGALALASITGCGKADDSKTEATTKQEVTTEKAEDASGSDITTSDAAEEDVTEASKDAGSASGDMDYSKMTAEDLVAQIKDPAHPTVDEYVALLSTYQYVNITDELELEENITREAVKMVSEAISDAEDGKYPDTKQVFDKLIVSESPQVRACALTFLGGLFGVDGEGIKVCMDLIENEKDPYVIKQLVDTLSNEGGTDPAIGKFLVEMSENENDQIRLQATYALANPWSENVEGAVDAVIRLMNDDNEDIRSYARKNSGRLKDEAVIAPLVEVLNDPDQGKSHGDAVSGLCYLWFDYPFHEQTSEAAYQATIDYWKNTPRTETTPFWTSFTYIKNVNESKFDAWKANAPYFNEEEICAIMKDIVLDENVDWLARTGAMDVIFTYGTVDYCKGLQGDIEALTDAKAGQILDAYTKKLEKMESDSANATEAPAEESVEE